MRLFYALVLGTALVAGPAPQTAARPAAATAQVRTAPLPAPERITSVEGITEYRLGNGLRVLLFPDASQANMTVNITYLVGSRNESYGETGMAHLLEHLLFKGTDQHPDVPKVLNSLGANFNGSTWYDRTNYFVTFPASEANLRAALELEADRMVNSHIWQKDLWDEQAKRGEMTVVRNEFEMGENNPMGVTIQRVESVAYDWHNYGKSTIGARSDIEHVNIAHLKAFYQRYYQPDNAVLLVAGRIDEAKVLGQINELFGVLPRPARTLEKTWTEEPVQDGERSVTVRRVGGTPLVIAGYHVPAPAHPDNDALGLAVGILVSQPSGRLYKALVETKLASAVFPNSYNTLEPTFQEFIAVLPKDGQVEAVRDAMLKVLEDLREHPFTQEELDRSKAEQEKAYQLIQSQTVRLAISLSEAMADGDWRLYFLGRERIQKTTLAEVQRAAETYFKPANRTLGTYLPTEKPDRVAVPASPDVASLLKDFKGREAVSQGEAFAATPANIEARTVRFTAPNGLKGAILAKKTKGESVNATLTLHLGREKDLMNLGAAPDLAGGMLMRGTAAHTRQQLKDELDRLKAQVTLAGGADTVTARITATRSTLPATLRLVAEMLKESSFPAAEFQTLVQEHLTGLEQQRNEPNFLASQALRQHMDPYPAGHPRHVDSVDESVAELKAATPEQAKAFHDRFYGAQAADLAIVGDVDAAAAKALALELFGAWTAKAPFERMPQLLKPVQAMDRPIETPDKANAIFIAAEGMPLRNGDADYPALMIANHILGGGAKNRLVDRIRQKEGISYGVGSGLNAGAQDAAAQWFCFAIYAPENLAKLDAAFHEELGRALKEGFTPEELAAAKQSWKQDQEVELTQDPVLSSKLSGYLFLDRTLAFDADLAKKVDTLSLDQVNGALRKWLDPARLSIVKAGDFAKSAKAAK
ncbi:MAG TPA: pitrilysin family protein [Holophagaceae bacterium]|nr:pitrilysin family protein [Holophagaceae bacterium]